MYHYISSVRQPRKITFISDRMRGIERGQREGWTRLYHRHYCMRHIKANFRKMVVDAESEKWLYQAGIASTEDKYLYYRRLISLAGNNYIEESLGDSTEIGRLSRWAQHADDG